MQFICFTSSVGSLLFVIKIQSITLFIDRAVTVPEGSKITVTQNGVTGVYEKSGKPAIYSTHQEIPLELFKGWA